MSVFDAKPFEKLLAIVRRPPNEWMDEEFRYEVWVWPDYGVVAPARTTTNGNVAMAREAVENDLASGWGYTVEYLVPPEKWLETYEAQTAAYRESQRAPRGRG